MSDDEKALIAAIRATPTFGDETRNELLGLALQAADALEARVHPTVCGDVFYLDGPDDKHVCARSVGHLSEGFMHCDENPQRLVSWGFAETPPTRVHPTVTDAEVEAGAIAAYVIDYPFRSTDGWIKTHPANRENYRTLARAALEAARAVQPTTKPEGDTIMANTAEEAMLFAAMEDDQGELDRLANDATPSERRYLTKALDRVYNALVSAEEAEATP